MSMETTSKGCHAVGPQGVKEGVEGRSVTTGR